VEREELSPAAERRLDGRAERLDVRKPVVSELRACPLAHGELALVRDLRARVRVEQEVVGVAEDDRTAELSQTRDDGGRLAPALDRVAEADDLVDRVA